MLVHNGYKYIRDRSRGANTYWCCKEFKTKVKCHGRAKTVGDEVIETQPHICSPSTSAAGDVQKAKASNGSSNDVVNECLAGASDAADPKITSMATTLQRKSKKKEILNRPNKKCPKPSSAEMFTTTTRGKQMLVHKGYRYIRDYGKADRIYWACKEYKTNEKCPGRAKTVGNDVFVTQPHSCVPSLTLIEATRIRNKILQTAKNSNESPKAVINECLAGASHAVIATLPKLSSLATTIKRKRRLHGLPDNPHSRAEIIIHEDYRTTRTQLKEEFVLLDTGAEDPDRIIIFASATDLDRLSRCGTWLADSSFKTSPGVFYHLWVLHGLYWNRVVPFVYCLLPNKSEEIYRRALAVVLNAIGERRPMMIITDFEKAAENAIRALIPPTHVAGCWFHFNQSIWQSIQNLGLAERFDQEPEYAMALKKFSVLALCDVQDVSQRFEHLADQFLQHFGDSEPHQDFIEYMENMWIGRLRRTPLFPIEMWNSKYITEFQLPSTKNSVEYWHRNFQNICGCLRQNFFRFLVRILNENVKVDALCSKLDAGEEVPVYSKVEYKQANQRLMDIIQNYHSLNENEYFIQCVNYVYFT
uniref:FLYWCH-type domain-containing protein n=1 Tax=Meloidogyne hapla TaxID=6305 RepID=A0A1I8BED6_MELHA